MRFLLPLLLFFAPLLAAPPCLLADIDQEICCLEQRHISLLSQAESLERTANFLYWHHGMEADVRSLRWRACRKRRTARAICCRLQKLQAVRNAIVRQAHNGVFFNQCDT